MTSHCIILPHYRHVDQLTRFIPELAALMIPVIVVDDGSPADEQQRLTALLAPYAHVQLHLCPINAGKGAASIQAMQLARDAGYTHAISMDADGQHPASAVAGILALSEANPESICSGQPIFGEDIPKSRLYGRMITNGLVKVATLSTRLRDAMCGFRVYPIDQTLALCRELAWRVHMEFDVELLVRAVWRNIEVLYHPTPVSYPADGASHFRMVVDNVRLTAMHTWLILAGILRSPILIWRKLN